MLRRPPRSTLTATPFPTTTRFRSAAAPRPAPAIKAAVTKPAGIAPFVRLSFRRFFRVQSLKIIPVLVVFSDMFGTEIPTLRAIGRFGCRTGSGRIATVHQKYQRSGLLGDLGAGQVPGESQPCRSHSRT